MSETKTIKELKGSLVNLADLKEGDVVQNKLGLTYLPKFFYVNKISKSLLKAGYDQKSKDWNGKVHSHYTEREFDINYSGWNVSDKRVKVLTGQKAIELKKRWSEQIEKTKFINLCTGPLSRVFGADPEFFIEDGMGSIIPAFSFLPDKKHPKKHSIAGTDMGSNMYWDGFQAEFTFPPVSCMQIGGDQFREIMTNLLNEARKVDPKAKISAKTLIEVSEFELANARPEHIEFGCEPSKNAYELKGDLVSGGRNIKYRSAGGHIHLGIGKQSKNNEIKIVKALDAILGVACVSFFEGFDSPLRRQYYGLPGEYRTPPWGIEYRVLSNAWLFHPVAAHLVIDLARLIANFGFNDGMKNWKTSEADTIETIIKCDAEKARKIMMDNKDILNKILSVAYRDDIASKVAFSTLMKPMSETFVDPTNIEKNWAFGLNSKNHCGDIYRAHCLGAGQCWQTSWQLINEKKKI